MEKTHRDQAIETYAYHGEPFFDEERWHLNNGWVISVPYQYAMGYFYKEDNKIILHVSYASGDMVFLLKQSLNNYIDIIEFKRNFTGRVRRYDYNKFLKRI